MSIGNCEIIGCAYVGPLTAYIGRDGCATLVCDDCLHGLHGQDIEEGDAAWNDWPSLQDGDEFQFPQR